MMPLLNYQKTTDFTIQIWDQKVCNISSVFPVQTRDEAEDVEVKSNLLDEAEKALLIKTMPRRRGKWSRVLEWSGDGD